MRALIRGKEVCLEKDWTGWQRANLAFLTGTEVDSEGNPLPGDGWTLVEDYVAPVEDAVAEVPPVAETPIEAIEDTAPSTVPGETVEIGGKTYSLEDLKKLIE